MKVSCPNRKARMRIWKTRMVVQIVCSTSACEAYFRIFKSYRIFQAIIEVIQWTKVEPL